MSTKKRRTQKYNKRKWVGFDYANLFLELKSEVRKWCTSSSRCMLSMTCKEERKVSSKYSRRWLIWDLAATGDEHWLLRNLLMPAKEKRVPVHKLHSLLHVAICFANVSLVEWFIRDGRWRLCSHCLMNAILISHEISDKETSPLFEYLLSINHDEHWSRDVKLFMKYIREQSNNAMFFQTLLEE
jgi:hypothetical protein